MDLNSVWFIMWTNFVCTYWGSSMIGVTVIWRALSLRPETPSRATGGLPEVTGNSGEMATLQEAGEECPSPSSSSSSFPVLHQSVPVPSSCALPASAPVQRHPLLHLVRSSPLESASCRTSGWPSYYRITLVPLTRHAILQIHLTMYSSVLQVIYSSIYYVFFSQFAPLHFSVSLILSLEMMTPLLIFLLWIFQNFLTERQ